MSLDALLVREATDCLARIVATGRKNDYKLMVLIAAVNYETLSIDIERGRALQFRSIRGLRAQLLARSRSSKKEQESTDATHQSSNRIMWQTEG